MLIYLDSVINKSLYYHYKSYAIILSHVERQNENQEVSKVHKINYFGVCKLYILKFSRYFYFTNTVFYFGMTIFGFVYCTFCVKKNDDMD